MIHIQLFQLIPNESYLYTEQEQLGLIISNDNINSMSMTEKEELFAAEIDTILANLSVMNQSSSYKRNKLFNLDKYKIPPFSVEFDMKEMIQLESEIFEWIISIQYPLNKCPQKLYQCMLNKCGFGCIIRNELLMCAKKALHDGIMFDLINYENTLIDKSYGYWNKIFLPLSNIKNLSISCKNITNISKQIPNTKGMGYWIPSQFESRLKELHSDPVLLFHGILTRYFFRFVPNIRKLYDQLSMHLQQKLSAFPNSSVIGVHIRRSDKSSEANLYPLIVYLKVIKYYLQIRNEYDAFIILATDDKHIVEYILSNNIINRDKLFVNPYSIGIDAGNESVTISQRKSKDNALISIVFDMLLLSQSDFFIGQDSSNVGAVVVQLLSTRFVHHESKSVSLDCLFKDKSFLFPYFVNGVYV